MQHQFSVQKCIHAMQRKIQEAEDAKKRLATLKIRAAKRTAAGASMGGPGKLPSGSISSLSGSVSRTGSTPIAAITGASANEGGTSTKGANPIAGDPDSGAVPSTHAAKDSIAESVGGAGALPNHACCCVCLIW